MPPKNARPVGREGTVNRFIILGVLLLAAGAARGQVIQVTGGASTLFDAEGAGATLMLPGNTSQAGVGLQAGRFVYGASDSFNWRGNDFTLGDSQLNFSTGEVGLTTALRGVEISRKNFAAFIGAAGQTYSVPYFSTTNAKHFGAGFLYKRALPHGLDFTGTAAITGAVRTALEGVHFKWRDWQLSENAGLLNSRPYLDLRGARRFRHYDFSAAHQNFIFVNKSTTVNSEQVSAMYGPIILHASAFQSGQTKGETYGGAAHFWAMQVQANEYVSALGKTSSLVLTENFTRHFSVSQYLTRSQGKDSVNFGGAYTGNRFTASVGYQTYFVPSPGRAPFQQAISVQVSFGIRGAAINAATQMTPDGKVRWSAYGSRYLQAAGLDGLAVQGTGRDAGGRYEISGSVVDSAGQPVEGCAVILAKQTVYSNAAGQFTARFPKATAVPVRVDLDDSTMPGTWALVSASESAVPGQPMKIVVRRIQ